jgi:fumarylacetoacetate (FAA) hydrolase family protein
VAIRADGVFDVTKTFPTMRDLCETRDPAASLKAAAGERIGTLADILTNTPPERRDGAKPWLLAPIDLQAIKAAGVTFAISMIERVIEERARGNPQAADGIRQDILRIAGIGDLKHLQPGSKEAATLKEALIAQDMWSQYLEVGIGPDAEIFSKAQPMAAVGTGMDAGLHPMSTWNNPEPEVVLVVASDGRIVGATLGNDVNLRDVEGRSALLLSKAKDNNASCAIGRDLVAQMVGPYHQYPDGAVLFLGTLFAPTKDRDGSGKGFTHKVGDIVTVAAAELGSLVNRMRYCQDCEPWRFGTGHLARNLARRGLLA